MKFDFNYVIPEYHKEFSNDKDIEREFGIKLSKDFEILFAYYSYEDYSGEAIVLGYDTVKQAFFEVYGSHCSCYGLSSSNSDCNQDTQWEPEYIDNEILDEWLTKKATTRFPTYYVGDSAKSSYKNFLLKYVVKE